MNLNMHIILDELKTLQPLSHINDSIALNLKQVKLMNRDFSGLSNDYLYVTDAELLTVNLREAANQNIICCGDLESTKIWDADFNLIVIRQKIDIGGLLNKIQDIFLKYQMWDQEMLHATVKNEPLQKIFNIGTALLDNPVAAFDASMGFIMKGGELPDNYKGTIWEDVLNYGYPRIEVLTPKKQKEMFKFSKQYEPYLFKQRDSDKHNQLIANLFVNNRIIGFLGSIDIVKPFTMGQVSIFSHLKTVMETVIANSREISSLSMLDDVYFIDRLLKGLNTDEKIISFHLNKIRWKIEDNYYIIHFSSSVVDFSDETEQKTYIFRIKKF